MLKHTSTLLLLFFLGGCASSGVVTIKGASDQLEEYITVSSFGYDRPAMGIIPVTTADPFFRAHISKASKKQSLQLYVMANSNDWSYWNEARFNSGSGLTKIKLDRISSDVDCSQYGCSHYEDMIGRLTIGQVESFANSQSPTIVRIGSSKVSTTVDVKITPQEAKAFLAKLKMANS